MLQTSQVSSQQVAAFQSLEAAHPVGMLFVGATTCHRGGRIFDTELTNLRYLPSTTNLLINSASVSAGHTANSCLPIQP